MLVEDFSVLDLLKFYCNVKIEYKPKRRKLTIPIIFFITFFINITILNVLIDFTHQYSIIVETCIILPMIVLYFSLLFGPSP
jgi:hypothetical protein